MSTGRARLWAEYFPPAARIETIWVYDAGTTDVATIWSDWDKTTERANPLTADANGWFTFYGDGDYKLVMLDANGTVTKTLDWLRISDTRAHAWPQDNGLVVPGTSGRTAWETFVEHDGSEFQGLWVNQGASWARIVRPYSPVVYNVQDYIGDEPDGTTNNTSDIQQAIRECEATGGTLYFPASLNAYRASGLMVKEPIVVVGDGRGSRIDSIGDGFLFSVDEGTRRNVEGQNPGVVFANMLLTGNARTDEACAFGLAHLDHSLFMNLWIEEFWGTNEGPYAGSAFTFVDSVRESHFVDVRMRYCGRRTGKYVIDVSDAGGTTQDASNNNLFQRCAVVYYYGDGVVISNPGDAANRPRGFKFLDCLFHGVVSNVPIHEPTTDDQRSRPLVFNDTEANIVQDCRFSTGPVENPYIYVNDSGEGAPATGAPTVEVRNCLFTQHLTSAVDMRWGIKVDAGTVVIRGNTFVAQDPAWEVASGASVYRDDSNILIGAPASDKIIEADGSGPDVFHGDGLLQDLPGNFTIQLKDEAGALQRRFTIKGNTDEKEFTIMGVNVRLGEDEPTHETNVDGAPLPAVALYIRQVGGLSRHQVFYWTTDQGENWHKLENEAIDTLGGPN